MFKSKNKISYSTRGRTIEQNNSGKIINAKASKTYSKSSTSKPKKSTRFNKKSK